MRNVEDAYGDFDSQMKFFWRFSSIQSLRKFVLGVEMGYILQEKVSGVPSLKLIAWSSSLSGGKRRAASSEKTSVYSLYCSGMVDAVIVFFPLCAASAHCWARFVLLMTICTSSPWSFLAFLAKSRPMNRIRDICAHSGGSRFVVQMVTLVLSTSFSFQLIWGLNSCNHGKPKSARSSARSVM